MEHLPHELYQKIATNPPANILADLVKWVAEEQWIGSNDHCIICGCHKFDHDDGWGFDEQCLVVKVQRFIKDAIDATD